jgi:hypothetical protein
MPHSRDVRTHASEIKFVVSTELAARIRQWARTHLDPDPHGSGRFGDEYQTTSIYFDTGGLDVFHRRGSFGRSKYRIRRYGTAQVAFLERKMRQPSVLAKRRTLASLTALDRLGTAELDSRRSRASGSGLRILPAFRSYTIASFWSSSSAVWCRRRSAGSSKS